MKSSKKKVISWWGKGGDKGSIHQDDKVSKKRVYYMWSEQDWVTSLCIHWTSFHLSSKLPYIISLYKYPFPHSSCLQKVSKYILNTFFLVLSQWNFKRSYKMIKILLVFNNFGIEKSNKNVMLITESSCSRV